LIGIVEPYPGGAAGDVGKAGLAIADLGAVVLSVCRTSLNPSSVIHGYTGLGLNPHLDVDINLGGFRPVRFNPIGDCLEPIMVRPGLL